MFISREAAELLYTSRNEDTVEVNPRFGYVDHYDGYTYSAICTFNSTDSGKYSSILAFNTLTIEEELDYTRFYAESFTEKLRDEGHPYEFLTEGRASEFFVDPCLARKINPSVDLVVELENCIKKFRDDPFFLCDLLLWYCRWFQVTPSPTPFIVDDTLEFETEEYDAFIVENSLPSWVQETTELLKSHFSS